MKTPALCLFLTLLGGAHRSEAAYYRVGDVVTSFLVYAREASYPGAFPDNYPIQLRDFAGSVLFVEFFDPT